MPMIELRNSSATFAWRSSTQRKPSSAQLATRSATSCASRKHSKPLAHVIWVATSAVVSCMRTKKLSDSFVTICWKLDFAALTASKLSLHTRSEVSTFESAKMSKSNVHSRIATWAVHRSYCSIISGQAVTVMNFAAQFASRISTGLTGTWIQMPVKAISAFEIWSKANGFQMRRTLYLRRPLTRKIKE